MRKFWKSLKNFFVGESDSILEERENARKNKPQL